MSNVGRFGPRYGRKVRIEIADIEKFQKLKYNCPVCLKPSLKRIAKGIWVCKKCKLKFAGKAYKPY
jgi:large subunit ribosomal protein L37Ae